MGRLQESKQEALTSVGYGSCYAREREQRQGRRIREVWGQLELEG